MDMISFSTGNVAVYPTVPGRTHFSARTDHINHSFGPLISKPAFGCKISDMITDSAGNVENIIPKSVEDVMDKEIAAMSLEERAAVILALAGSWADRTDITLTDDRINPEGWDFEDLTDLYAPKLPL